MKNFLVFFLFSISIYAQLPNDCVGNVVVCGNSDINVDVNGLGTQELSGANNCGSQEHNTFWFKVTVASGGTLGFVLTPNSTSINEDYDFFVFGPNVSCDNLGNSIRCSTTNPLAASQGNNLTGMKDTSDDELSEGPGIDGDSFVEWLTVQADETYYFVIDRPIGNSPFSLEWTGTANFYESPNNELPNGQTLNYVNCDPSGNGIAPFDLTQDESLIIAGQNVSVAYFDNISDAQLGVNNIQAPSNYNGTTSTVFIKLTDIATECFSIFDIDLLVFQNITLPALSDIYLCDDNNDGVEVFDFSQNSVLVNHLATNFDVSYYLSEAEANLGQSPLVLPYSNTVASQVVWMRFVNVDTGCFGINSFEIEVFKIPIATQINNWITCDNEDNDGFYSFDLSALTANLLNGQNESQINISFHQSQVDADFKITPYSLNHINKEPFELEEVFVRLENVEKEDCYTTTSFFIQVIENPIFDIVEDTKYICVNLLPQTVEFEIENMEGNYVYSWKDDLGNELSTSTILNATQQGDYTITATTNDVNSCVTTKTVHLLAVEPAEIVDLIINEYWQEDNFSLEVVVTGTGIYEYAIDDINGIYQESNILLNIQPGFHTVYVKEMNNCGITSKEVTTIGFKKFFSPNNDGINDIWKVQGIVFKPEDKITIFNRFGKVIHIFYPALNQGWNGIYNGKTALEGEYWFTAQMTNHNGNPYIRKGHFSLVIINE